VFCGLVVVSWLGLAGTANGADARRTSDFIDSIGVNTHSYYGAPPYEDYVWREKLLASGVRHIRENLQRDSPKQVARINDLFDAGGIDVAFIFDPRSDRGGSVSDLVSQLKGSMLAATAQVEGPNEYETAHRADWELVAEGARAYQEDLYSAIKSDPATAHLTVLGPSVAYPSSYAAWGDLSASLDEGNMHSYPGGRPPSANLRQWITAAATTSGAKPVQATETGYHNALLTTNGHLPASERAAAIYVPRTFLEYFREGVKRTYAYELLSEGTSESNAEHNFGLLRNDYSDKPAMVALRNLIRLLDEPGFPLTSESPLTPPALAYSPASADDPGSSSTAGSLNYSLIDLPTDVRQLLLQKSDGSFWLALWREVSVWDEVDRIALDRSRPEVTLVLHDPVTSARSYLPNISTAPLREWLAPSQLTLNVGPEVTLVEIIPATRTDTSTIPVGEPTTTPTPGAVGDPTPTATPGPNGDPTPTSTPTVNP